MKDAVNLSSTAPTRPLSIAVPALNEEKLIRQTLESLAAQHHTDFTVVVVDNGSTDRSCVDHGATWLARTDSDCLAAPDWTARIMAAFDDGLELVAGQLLPRTDEGITEFERRMMLLAVEVASFFGRIRPGNKGEGYLGPYQMLPGCNMAITADMYHRSGGFPRTRIEELHEDRALSNRVRKLSRAYALRRDVVVYGSSRRVKAWGLKNTLAWYADHRYRPEVVDIR